MPIMLYYCLLCTLELDFRANSIATASEHTYAFQEAENLQNLSRRAEADLHKVEREAEEDSFKSAAETAARTYFTCYEHIFEAVRSQARRRSTPPRRAATFFKLLSLNFRTALMIEGERQYKFHRSLRWCPWSKTDCLFLTRDQDCEKLKNPTLKIKADTCASMREITNV